MTRVERLAQIRVTAGVLRAMPPAAIGRVDVLCGDIHANTGTARRNAADALDALIAEYLPAADEIPSAANS